MRIELDAWRLDVPPGWSVAVAGDRSWCRFFFAGRERSDDDAIAIEASGLELSFQRVALGEVSVAEFARAAMQRHVRQGSPDRLARSLDGRAAEAFAWSNGVQHLETLFVAETATTILRIDLPIAVRFDGTSLDRAPADALLASFRWTEAR